MKAQVFDHYIDHLQSGRTMPYGTWRPDERGLFNSKRLLRFLMFDVLGMKEEEVREFRYTVDFIDDYGLSTPLRKLFNSSVRKFVMFAFPLIMDGVRFPIKGGKWQPFPWTGNVIRITEQVLQGEQTWPSGFWTDDGCYGRAKLVANYLKNYHNIELMKMSELNAMAKSIEEPRRILHDGLF